MDLIYCLWRRQIMAYLRAPGRVFSALAQPFLFLVALGLGFSPIYQQAGRGDYFAFLVPGVLGSCILFNAVFAGNDLLWDRQFGFIKETMVAPASRTCILFGRALGVTTVALIQAVLVGVVCSVAGLHKVPAGGVLIAFGFAVLIAIFFSFIGSILGSVLKDTQSFGQIVNFVATPLFYLSGAVFPLEGQKLLVVTLTSLNPLSYGIDGMRGALGGQYYYDPLMSVFILIVVNIVAAFAATFAFSRVRPD